MTLAFTVPGVPAPQGSKNPWGGEANARTRPWRAAVSAEAALHWGGRPLLGGPVEVAVQFAFPRPKAHYGTGRNANKLKDSAPEFVTKAPDLDKLARAIGDALTGIVYRDDAQIARLEVEKVYGHSAGAQIEVRALAVSRLTEGMAAA